MKRIVTIIIAVVCMFSFSSCSIIRDKLTGALRSAAAEFSFSPDTDETVVTAVSPDTTVVIDDTERPADTKAPDNTEAVEDEQSPPPESGIGLESFLAEIPQNIPVFIKGTPDSNFSMRNESDDSITYNLKFDGVKKEDVKTFGAEIKKAGFEVYVSESNTMYSVTGTKMKGNNVEAMISLNFDSSGSSCYYMLMLYKSKQ